MTIKQGALVYDKASGRYDIRSGLDEYYGGLHCGQTFEVFDREQCRATRIEMNLHQKWYLASINTDVLDGLQVRSRTRR